MTPTAPEPAAPEPTPPAPQPEGRSLRASALNSTLWTTAGFGVGQALRLVSNIVLAALLYQEAFALMALVTAVMQGLVMFSDIGLGPSIVQNKRGDDRDFLDTAWTIQVVRGVGLAALAALSSWPVAAFYAANDPTAWELRGLLPIVALSMLVEAFQSTKMKTAARRMDLGRITLVEFGSQIAGLVTMISLAFWTRSVYALAFGNLASMTCLCVLSHWAIPGENNRFRWEKEAVYEIVHFGKWVFLSTLITFFASQLDKLVVARLFPFDQVGVYGIAVNLTMLTPLLMGKVLGSVAFPLYARLLERKEPLEQIMRRTKAPILGAGGYLVALAIAGAHSFVDFAYDDRYAAAGSFIPLLAVGAWFQSLDSLYGTAFLASGRTKLLAAANAVKVIAFVALLFPAMKFDGIIGAILALVASDAIRMTFSMIMARGLGIRDQRPELWASLFLAAVALGTLALVRLVPVLANAPPILGLAVEFTVVTAAFAPWLLRTLQALRGRNAI